MPKKRKATRQAARKVSRKKLKEKRKRNRWQVAVLVRAAIPKFGDELFELEMWAKDVNEGGLRLELAKGLNISHISSGGNASDSRQLRFDDVDFTKGTRVKIQDLFYDDEGSPFINGKVAWARRTPNGWDLGIEFTDTKKQSKALLGAFKDFLSIVKNPMDAVEKASRRN